MKKSLALAVVLAATLSAGYGVASAPSLTKTVTTDVVYHGGGCRKNSPPGQCCHKQSSTGIVHCH